MNIRIILSCVVSFIFYFSWAYWANNAVDIPKSFTLQTALIQGVYSATVVLFFTIILEKLVIRYKHKEISLALLAPVFNKFHTHNSINFMSRFVIFLKQTKISGALFAPVIPILLQSIMVIVIHIVNQTPNLALTVAPSILFTTLYAYVYVFTFLKK